MKPWIKNRMVITIVLLLVTTCLLSIGGAALGSQSGSDSGITGLQGPTTVLGIVLGIASGGDTPSSSKAALVYNNAPFEVTGYALSKSPGSIHVWISSASQAVLDLGYKSGDIVTIFAGESQVADIKTGDWVEIAGFTVRGQLVHAYHSVLPSPFGY
jgi:hypothetical protein